MRIRFEGDGLEDRGLRLIHQIPDVTLARLEGRNGIGKTLAARLLELISGQHPFAAIPQAWESLVDTLGKVRIVIDGLVEGEIVVEIDSREWEGRSSEDCAKMPGRVLLGGEVVDWPTARRIVQFRRVAGDEGLAETLALTLRQRAIEAEVRSRAVGQALSEWTPRNLEIARLCAPVSPESLTRGSQRISELQSEVDGLRTELSNHQRLVESREGALAAVSHAYQIAKCGPLLETYDVSTSRRADAEAQIDVLERQLTDLGAAAVQSKELRAELVKYEGLLERRRTALGRAQLEERRVHRFLGQSGRLTWSEQQGIRRSLQGRIAELDQLVRTGFLAGGVRRAAVNIENALRELPAEADDEVIADVNGPILVRELAGGVARRRVILEGVPKPGDVARFEEEKSELEFRRSILGQLNGIYKKADQKAKLVAEAEARIDELLQLPHDAQETRDRLLSSLLELRGILLETTSSAITALSVLGGLAGDAGAGWIGRPSVSDADEDDEDDGEDEEDEEVENGPSSLTINLPESAAVKEAISQTFQRSVDDARRLGALDIPTSLSRTSPDVENRLATLVSEAELSLVMKLAETREAEARLGKVVEDHSAAAADLAAVRASLYRAVRDLTDPDGPWETVSEFVAKSLLNAGVSDEWIGSVQGGADSRLSSRPVSAAELAAASVIGRIAYLASQVEDSAARVRDAWGSLSLFANTETRKLAPRISSSAFPDSESNVSGSSYPLLRQWAQDELGQLLSNEALRRELFEGSPVVEYDLENRSAVWESHDGRRRRRPLEAFSSGEQAFAYTRAKLETFESVRAEANHVVIFLDEFGAFIAQDRFSELMGYVHDHVLGRLADQVIVMVPLSSARLLMRGPATEDDSPTYFGGDYIVSDARTADLR